MLIDPNHKMNTNWRDNQSKILKTIKTGQYRYTLYCAILMLSLLLRFTVMLLYLQMFQWECYFTGVRSTSSLFIDNLNIVTDTVCSAIMLYLPIKVMPIKTLKATIYIFTMYFTQVRLHVPGTVIRIATKGCADWMTKYRLAYSDDCVTFHNLLDAAGNNIVIICV